MPRVLMQVKQIKRQSPRAKHRNMEIIEASETRTVVQRHTRGKLAGSMDPQFASSILLGQQAAAKLTPDQEAFLKARDQFAAELNALSGVAVGRQKERLAIKLACCASNVSQALDRAAMDRELKYLEDALLQARREGILPTDLAIPTDLVKR